jgi:hypothetical protein
VTRRIGEVLAVTCPSCNLVRCPCPDDLRPVAFVRGVCAVPTMRPERTRPRNPRPGTGRHRRRPLWSRNR